LTLANHFSSKWAGKAEPILVIFFQRVSSVNSPFQLKGVSMSGFIEGENRQQSTLFPERVDDYVGEDSPVRVIDYFIDKLDISGLGFEAEAADTGRPGYHPRTMLKIYVYGYLNQVHSSRRLEREAQRNVELMWLTGRLAPDFKTMPIFASTTTKRSGWCAGSS